MKFLNRKPNDDKTIQDVIDDVIAQMSYLDKTSPEFEELITRLERLQKAKKNNSSSFRIPPEVWVPSAVTILTTLLVINAEHVGVVTSKAFSFVPKPRV